MHTVLNCFESRQDSRRRVRGILVAREKRGVQDGMHEIDRETKYITYSL